MYEPRIRETESGGFGFLVGLLCGAAAGAALGLMFAPKAGAELRQNLYESGGNFGKRAREVYNQASEQMNSVVSKGRQAVERGREAFDSARQGVNASDLS